MGQFGAENDIFIFKALHVRASFPRLFLECLPSIYECFMFLEFWLKLFIKIAIDENVFFSLNSREIAENDGFWSELEVNRGLATRKILADVFQGFLWLVRSYSNMYHYSLDRFEEIRRMNRAFKKKTELIRYNFVCIYLA